MKQCPNCGFPVEDRMDTCPKCDEDLAKLRASKPLIIDLAHHGEDRHAALRKLEEAISNCLWNGHSSLKVIHGHGSTTGRSTLKPHILAAMKRQADRLHGRVIPDGDNPGAHILTFNESP